jgi:integrase
MTSKNLQKTNQNAFPNLLGEFSARDWPDTISAWAAMYFKLEVTTSERSQKEQQRDLKLFIEFMLQQEGSEQRMRWTPRLSRSFVDALRKALKENGSRRWSDRTINRVIAHLKTFAKWIHKLQPFPLGNPTGKLKSLIVSGILELERALTEPERRKLLDAADHLPVIGGRSKDRRRTKDKDLPDERPRRKGYRPWRNRAIVYVLVETGMRRAEVTSINLNEIDFEKRTLLITEKGGQQRRILISKEGMKAIDDYLTHERGEDAETHAQSNALFLPAATVVNSFSGRLSPTVINSVWNEACQLAHIKHRTPHSARHAMGVHLVKKTGNPRTAQRQLGHRNPSTTMQYMQFTHEEMQEVLDER